MRKLRSRRSKGEGRKPNTGDEETTGGRRVVCPGVSVAALLFLNGAALLLTAAMFSNGGQHLAPLSSFTGNAVDDERSAASTTTAADDSFVGRPVHPVLKKALAKVSGDGWDLDPRSVLESTEKHHPRCRWIDFVSTTGKTAEFCGHGEGGDLVTRTIERKKRWGDCDVLPRYWNSSAGRDENSVYIEIGGNIGACVVEMLLSTDAKIIAFEPHPRNQFVLLNTIRRLPPPLRERFVLVPIALGRESSRSEIFSSPRNMGNSVVGQIVKDYHKQSEDSFEKHDIVVERISSILNAGSGVNVPLAKLDAQGFECQILEGLDQNLADRIHRVKFEVAPVHLRAQGCIDLFTRFRELGFDVETEGGRKITEGDNYGGGINEFVAVRRSDN